MVVAKFHKGYMTRYNIMQVAKRMFYFNGFNQTTITEICELANVKKGTFTYYFKTKQDIIEEIYGELLMQCYSYTGNNLGNLSSVQKNVTSVFLYYLSIFRDEKTIKFHYEVLIKESVGEYIGHHVSRIYKKFNYEMNLGFTEKDIENAASADVGIRRELSLRLLKKKNFEPEYDEILDFISTINIFMGRVFKMDENLMLSYIEQAKVFQATHDYSKIRLLL